MFLPEGAAGQALAANPLRPPRLSGCNPRAGSEIGFKMLLSDITLDAAIQPRVELDQFVIDEYAEAMASGTEFPPVVVFAEEPSEDSPDRRTLQNVLWLADGFHRVKAAEQAGLQEIEVDVRPGTRRDAILFSVGANAAHGKRRTNADKRHAVEILLEDPEWASWSDREVARQCAVSHSFVSALRQQLSVNGCQIENRKVQRGPSTYTMNAARIGSTQKIRPEVRETIRSTPMVDKPQEIERLARVAPEHQPLVAEKVASGEAMSVSKAVSQVTRELHEAHPAQLLPEGVFDVLYADPPWRYDFAPHLDGMSIEEHYPTMDLEEICALEVPAAEDAVLFLWATAPKLLEALEVMDSWGFGYKTQAMWDKEKIAARGAWRSGYWFLSRHELLLVGTKGRFSPPDPDFLVPSVFCEPRTAHSRKPDSVRQYLEKCFPADRFSWLELFAREDHQGWTTWGRDHAGI